MKNFEETKNRFKALDINNKDRYKVFPFLDEKMKHAYAAADFIVSRAGANSLAEIVALKKPSFVIPLASAANNHQYYNAKYFSDEKILLFEEEKNLTSELFLQKIEDLRERKQEFIDNLTKYNERLGNKKPVEIIVDEMLGFGKN